MILFVFQLTAALLLGLVPDKELTPGVILPVSKAQVCERGYAGKIRNVSESTKKAVYEEYKITSHKAGEYEIDHLISLELGGSNDIKNLWPQSYITKQWNAHNKDWLENHLHKLVCDNVITLEEAQKEISEDWIASYNKRLEVVKKKLFIQKP